MNPDAKECPFCGETIKFNAIICKHCSSSLDGSNAPAKKQTGQTEHTSSSQNNNASQQLISGFSSIVSILILAGLFITNPTKKEFIDYAIDEISSVPSTNELLSETGLLGKSLFRSGLSLFTTHKDYFLFSTFHVNTSAIDFFTGDSTSVKFIGVAGMFFPYGSHGFGANSTSVVKSTPKTNQSTSNDSQGRTIRNNSTNNSNSSAESKVEIPSNLRSRIDKKFDYENWTESVVTDINNDSVRDFIVSGTTSYWCGSGGCTHIAYISQGSDYKEVDLGTLYDVELDSRSRRLNVTTHGSACNLPGSESCKFQISWDGSGFVRH